MVKLDGWKNLLSSFGTRRDPGEYTRPRLEHQLERATVEAIYRADGIGRRIVDLPAEEMTRQWVTVMGEDGDQRQAELRRLGAKQTVNKALRWAGLYGGAVIVMIIDDGGELQDELVEARVRGVSDLIVYDRWQTSWTKTDIASDPGSRWYGRAERLMVTPVSGTPFTVHRSRVLVFDGEDIPDQLRSQNNGWGDSRLQPVFRALSRHGESMGGVSAIIRDFIQPVLSMNNLSDMIASGQEDVVKLRLELLGLSRSILNVLLIDADEESYTKQASSVAGISDLLQEIKHDISAASGIPQTKLWGRSPEGLNASGDSQTRDWYDVIKGEQEDKLLPQLEYIVRLLDIAGGRDPDDHGRWIEFNPLWQPSRQESVATMKTLVEGLTLGLDYGLIDQSQAEGILQEHGYVSED